MILYIKEQGLFFIFIVNNKAFDAIFVRRFKNVIGQYLHTKAIFTYKAVFKEIFFLRIIYVVVTQYIYSATNKNLDNHLKM